jgi:hypothetical protein
MTIEYITTAAIVLGLSCAQNVTFSLVSRARNRNHHAWHAIASVLSNSVWFLTFAFMTKSGWGLELIIPFTAGTTAGSLIGTHIAMKVEVFLNASGEAHLKKP